MPSPAVGRNDPCRCGSGRKYKKCCLAKDESERPRVQEPSLEPLGAPSDAFIEEVHEELARLDQWAHEADYAVENGDYQRAENLYEKIREHFPDQIDGSYLLAKIRSGQGRWAEAVGAYEQAIRVIEGDPDGFDDGEALKIMQRGREEALRRAQETSQDA